MITIIFIVFCVLALFWGDYKNDVRQDEKSKPDYKKYLNPEK